MVRQHEDGSLCLLGCCRLGLLDYSGGRRSILSCLRAIDMLRREKFMVCREGQLMERGQGRACSLYRMSEKNRKWASGESQK